MSNVFQRVAGVILVSAAAACATATAAIGPIPAPAVDLPLSTAKGQQTVVVAGGCFWGIQAVFQHVRGVRQATSGYSGGSADTAEYETVSTGTTGHAESVQVIFDPSEVTFGQILHVFFAVAHNPTELNFQGPDHGTQYRSVIFYGDADQKRVAQAYVTQLDDAHVFAAPIVTEIVPLTAFYAAEDYHQNYATLHPNDPYIVFNDAPKVANLKKALPALYTGK